MEKHGRGGMAVLGTELSQGGGRRICCDPITKLSVLQSSRGKRLILMILRVVLSVAVVSAVVEAKGLLLLLLC